MSPSPWQAEAEAIASGAMRRGFQQRQSWEVGDVREKPVLDVDARPGLRRVTLAGNVIASLNFGTGAAISITGIRPPLVAYLPGRAELSARPVDANGAEAVVSMVDVDGPGQQTVRVFQDAAGPVPEQTARAQCITAGTINSAGVAFAATPGDTIITMAPTEIVSGAFLLELEP